MLLLLRNKAKKAVKTEISFKRINDLIFYIKNNEKRKLCIPNNYIITILKIIYKEFYIDINRILYKLTNFLIY